MSRRRPLPLPCEEIPFVAQLSAMIPPLRFDALFGRSGPVELEIGMGKGLFLHEAARLRPAANFLGVECAGKWFRRAVWRFLRASRENVRLVQADAFDLLARWIPAGSLAALHVYFPDPWPKKRHSKRRLLQPAFYGLAARALAPGAPLLLASDVSGYFEEAVADITAGGLFRHVPWPEGNPDRIPTSYALKYLRQGRSLHYARFLRHALPGASGNEEMAAPLDPVVGFPDSEE